MEINDDIDSQISGLLNDRIEVWEHGITISKWLTGGVDNGRVGPVANGDSDGVQADIVNRLNGIGSDPAAPVSLELCVTRCTVVAHIVVAHAVELRCSVVAAHHIVPLVGHHPWLTDKPA